MHQSTTLIIPSSKEPVSKSLVRKVIVSYKKVEIEGEPYQISKQVFDYFSFASHLNENIFGKAAKQVFIKHLKQVMIKLCNYATSIVCFQSADSDFNTPNVFDSDTLA